MLPDKRRDCRALGSVTRVPRTAAGEPGRPLVGSVLRRRAAAGRAGARARRAPYCSGSCVGRYHGPRAHGPVRIDALRYLVFASRPARAVVGCLQFSSPAWRMAARVAWVAGTTGRGSESRASVNNAASFCRVIPMNGTSPDAVLARGLGRDTGGGLAAPLPPRGPGSWRPHGTPELPPRRFVPRRQLGGVGRRQRSRAMDRYGLPRRRRRPRRFWCADVR